VAGSMSYARHGYLTGAVATWQDSIWKFCGRIGRHFATLLCVRLYIRYACRLSQLIFRVLILVSSGSGNVANFDPRQGTLGLLYDRMSIMQKLCYCVVIFDS
jgi:hypothetical protein